MKKLLFIIIIAATAFVSCRDKKPVIQQPLIDVVGLRIDSVCFDTALVCGVGDDAPKCELSIKLPFAEGVYAFDFNDTISNMFLDAQKGEARTREYFQQTVHKHAQVFIDLFNSDIQDLSEDMPDYMRGGGYYLNVDYKLLTGPENIAVFQVAETTYTGGAHGSYYVAYINLDTTNGMIMTKADLFPAEKEPEVMEKIIAKMCAEYNCESVEQLRNDHCLFILCEKPFVSDNFRLNADGTVTFVYNQYEIAPYAIGVVEVTINI